MKFTPQQITDYLTDKTKIYAQHKTTCELAYKVEVHSAGIYPEKMMDERRPHESEETKEYREKIFVPITKDVPARVLSSLQKIRKSDDWLIQYPAEINPRIADEETLYEYCEEYFPDFESVTNYMFNVYMPMLSVDGNAICLVLPKTFEVKENEYYKPVAHLFKSEQVIDYKAGEYLIAWHEQDDVRKYIFATDESIQIYAEVERNEYVNVLDIPNSLGYLPAFRLGGRYLEMRSGNIIYESIFAPMIPYLDECVREYSDMQAEVVQHIHSEKWMWSNQECKTCSGIGKVKRGERSVKCSDCKGAGVSSTSPYTNIVVKAPLAGQTGAPIPPAGYITKDTGIVTIQNQRIKEHKYNALASVNHQFLDAVPLTNSGVAKAVDRDELNTFANWVAELLVAGMDKIYMFINDWRYSLIIPDAVKRKELLPDINVPTRFELLSSTYLIDEIKTARDAGVSSVLLNSMELEYANKKTNMPQEVKEAMEQAILLDPLPIMSSDDKLVALQNKGITNTDYVISCNINQFVKEALIEIDNFIDLQYAEKMNIMKAKALAIITANDTKQSIIENV